MIKKEINIIGGGCAALSLARLIRKLPNYKFNLFIGNKNKTNKDHFWGFWKVKINYEAYNKANHVWSKWSINTNDSKHILTSVKHPYCVIKRKKWLDICKKQLPSQKFTILENDVLEKDGQLFVKNKKINGDLVFDSRPPKIPSNILLQHFEGFVVTSEKDVFDEDIVTLMDFRCDQSRGMHFIYLLPFSKRKALVESTMFSKTVENKEFYSAEISKYLKKYFNLVKFTKSDHEKGIIPMHYISCVSREFFNIGTRGGAVRPSSGYAFTFIQKQAFQIISQIKNRKKINTQIHNAIDLFLDKIFINVINEYPILASKIFSSLARILNGDEMAKFMSGNASLLTTCKIIISMPKIPFIKSFFYVVYRKWFNLP